MLCRQSKADILFLAGDALASSAIVIHTESLMMVLISLPFLSLKAQTSAELAACGQVARMKARSGDYNL